MLHALPKIASGCGQGRLAQPQMLTLALSRDLEKMEPEKLIAHNPSMGYMTKLSRTPRRATGTFVPPVEGLTPRRSPCLLAKRRQAAEAAISTPVREAVRKAMRLQSLEILDYFMNMISK